MVCSPAGCYWNQAPTSFGRPVLGEPEEEEEGESEEKRGLPVMLASIM